jgi:hypothetical protein
MMKLMALVCVATLTFAASGLGMHRAGWFCGKALCREETREARCGDPVQSDAAMRFRQNQTTNWRLVMSIR